MNTVISIFVFLYGIIIGSFLNVCIYRIPKEESIAYPPSHCSNCNNKLGWKDLFPVFSFLFLKGKCRYCGEKISIQYPLVELVNGLLYLSLLFKFGFGVKFILICLFISLILVIGIIDYKTQDIYDNTIYVGVVLGVLYIGVEKYLGGVSPFNYILGAVIAAGILALIAITTKAMGWGDVELVFIIGLFLGWPNALLMLFISIVLGGIVGGLLLLIKYKSIGGHYMAFGPYIALAGYITLMYGNEILNWYLKMFI